MVDNVRANILTEENRPGLVKAVSDEVRAMGRVQRSRLQIIEAEQEGVEETLGRLWHIVETTDKVATPGTWDRIRKYEERLERLAGAVADARVVLAQSRSVLKDVDAIATYAGEMEGFWEESELAEGRAFVQAFVREVAVSPGHALFSYTVPLPDDFLVQGRVANR